MRYRKLIGPISMLAVLIVVAASCSSNVDTDETADSTPAATSASTSMGSESGTHITATIADMSISLSSNTAPAGDVTFDITNNGPSLHALTVLKTDIALGELPEDPDEPGQVVAEGEGIVPMGENGNIPSGTSTTLTLQLKPGTYQVICNLPGHYVAGMYTDLTVTK